MKNSSKFIKQIDKELSQINDIIFYAKQKKAFQCMRVLKELSVNYVILKIKLLDKES